ncbi:TPA: fimbrial protein [Serratia marcescens]
MKLNKCKTNKKIIFRVIALLPLALFARETWAANCTSNTSSITVNAGTFTVQRDASIGSPISNVIYGARNTITCIKDWSGPNSSGGIGMRRVTDVNSTTPTYNGNSVFNTSLSGIGTIMGASADANCNGQQGGNVSNFMQPMHVNTGMRIVGCAGGSSTGTTLRFNYQNMFQLIKTASPLSSGVINIKIAEIIPTSSASFNPVPVYLSATVNALACSVSTPNVNVTLPTVNTNSFTGTGNTQGDTPFTIGLQCDANARINATLNFIQDGDTTNQSVAALTGKGSAGIASGVGIQLLYGNTPLRNNVLTFLKTSSGGQELPAGAFTARYFQTKSTVQAGTANTTATMTLTYQ